jgi:high-affinity iron transporter
MRLPRFLAGFLLALIVALTLPAAACAQDVAAAQTAWRLLDYVAVDYAGAVQNGQVVSPAEYAEMVEFMAAVRARLAVLPPTAARPELVKGAAALQASVAAKAAPGEVARQAKTLGSALLAAYPTPLAPRQAPDVSRAAILYANRCASCHGAAGDARAPGAAGLVPPPIAFADAERARQRSVFGLYQVISQGLDGTAMASFASLPDEQRWALAFYVGRFAYGDAEAKTGQRLWQSDANLRKRFPNLAALTQGTPAALAAELGEDKAAALTAFLRRHPDAVTPSPGGTLDLTRARLAQSVKAYEAGNRRRATDLALSAYLDGFEPIEPLLKSRDNALMTRIEGAMGDYRAAIGRGAPSADVASQAERLTALFDAAERTLAPQQASNAARFAGAFTILIREGLEALLIVVAMIAFLRKADRADVLPYVHAGWVAALAAGGLTWAVATYLVSISGASRELTEGFGSLLAAGVLTTVGIWMHGKAQADVWQKYVREKLSRALSRSSAWFLFLLAFVVVYREVFETVLFYAALWSQGGGVAMLAGAGAAAMLLAIIARILLVYSRRLPITQFFALSSVLIAILAIVLAGKGVAGLQEAGLIDIHPVSGLPKVELLGFFPTWQGLLSQLLTLAIVVGGFWFNGRSAAPEKPAAP